MVEPRLVTSGRIREPERRLSGPVDLLLGIVLLPINLILPTPALIRIWRSGPEFDPVPWRHALRLQSRADTIHRVPADLGALKDELAPEPSRHPCICGPHGDRRLVSRPALRSDRHPGRPCLPSEAAVLLSACEAGWVFEGWTPWNERPFHLPADPAEAENVQREYERVSVRLYATMMQAIVEATNTSGAVH